MRHLLRLIHTHTHTQLSFHFIVRCHFKAYKTSIPVFFSLEQRMVFWPHLLSAFPAWVLLSFTFYHCMKYNSTSSFKKRKRKKKKDSLFKYAVPSFLPSVRTMQHHTYSQFCISRCFYKYWLIILYQLYCWWQKKTFICGPFFLRGNYIFGAIQVLIS